MQVWFSEIYGGGGGSGRIIVGCLCYIQIEPFSSVRAMLEASSPSIGVVHVHCC